MYVDVGEPLTDWQVAQLALLVNRLDLAPGPGGSRITSAWALEPELSQVLGKQRIPRWTTWKATQAVVLYPSSQLVAHVDPPISGRRFHIPLVVNDGCWAFSDGHWQQLVVGQVYQMDPTVVHGAVNWGTERRLHLMVDTED